MDQVVRVNGTEFAADSWRADCGQNPIGPSQAGTWQLQRNGFCPGATVIPHVIDVSSAIVPGQAYWIKASSYSKYAGPIGVTLDAPTGWVDFGRRLVPQYLELRNDTTAPRTVKLAHLASGTPAAGTPPLAGLVPLKYALITGLANAQGRVWQDLPSLWSTQLLAGTSVRLALLPNALLLVNANTNAAYQSILEVTDDS